MTEGDDPKSDSEDRQPSSKSLWALDGLNFFLADVRDGMGPFLGTFLREHHHWDAGRVGIALAASQIGTVLAQTPLGALVDRIRWKRMAGAIAAAVVAGGCVNPRPLRELPTARKLSRVPSPALPGGSWSERSPSPSRL